MQTALTYRTNRDLFSNYYLDEHLPETEAWDELRDEEIREAKADIMDLWEREKGTAPKRNESQLEEKFIRPMFRKLGIPFEVEESTSRTQRRPDYGFFESEAAARGAFERRKEGGDFYKDAVAVADAKRWGRPLDTRGSGEHERDFENPSYQIHVYLQEVDDARWGVLTDGKKWRLYYSPTSHRLDSYYEIDLPTVLEKGDLEDFKYFYLFFRHGAFLEYSSGECFLDEVYDESNVFAQELGEDLQDNIYEAIKILSEGFLQYSENYLDEETLVEDFELLDDPSEFEQARLDLIHDSSLIYLYRLIFVLYAEAEGRELLDTNNEIYEKSYSLNTLKQNVAEELDSPNPEYRDWQDNLWDRMDELFKLIDQGSKSRGIPEEDLYIPAYNGGLFRMDPDEADTPETHFLAKYQVGDAYLAEVIELLTRSQNGNGGGKIFVDYSSLDVRHLGSIYEGLLEYQLDVADAPLALEDGEYIPAGEGDEVIVEEGEVHLSTGSGERKVTGSYYTPEYVVEYIVENTLGPLVKEIRKNLAGQTAHDEAGFAGEFADRVFELKVLDPAMGSGHFLTNAIDYLAREIIDAQEKQAEQEGIETVDEQRDINWARRQVAQQCIYGVDLNPLAVELAKVSLWLRTLAAEQPLAFLDHHLKTGNSLVGSDIETVLDNGDPDNGVEVGQLTLQESFDRTRQQALEHVTDQFENLLAIDNETLDEIKEMESVYEKVRDDPLYQHLIAMANVHTAERFGLDVPGDAYERMAEALRDDSWSEIESQDWYRSAQAMAENQRFFHWELEFPIAFYEQDGERMENDGFDAVIGNPPYVRQEQIIELKPILQQKYTTYDSVADLYTYFIEQGAELLHQDGEFGFIVSNKFMRSDYGEELRKFLLKFVSIRELIDFHDLPVFSRDVSAYPLIILFNKEQSPEDDAITAARIESLDFDDLSQIMSDVSYSLDKEALTEDRWTITDKKSIEVLNLVEECGTPLIKQVENMFRGVLTGLNKAFVIDEQKKQELIEADDSSRELIKPFIRGNNINRYQIEDSNSRLIFAKRGIDIEEYPAVHDHLQQYKEELMPRPEDYSGGDWPGRKPGEYEWYEIQDAIDYWPYLEQTKIVYPDISDGSNFAMDDEQYYLANTCYFIPSNSYALLAVLNSNVINWYYEYVTSEYRGGYQRSFTSVVENFPIPSGTTAMEPDDAKTNLASLAKDMTEYRQSLDSLNPRLLDYLGISSGDLPKPKVGNTLGDLQMPVAGIAETPLVETTEEYEGLRIEGVSFEDDDARLLLSVDISYKIDEDDPRETDSWDRLDESEFETYEAMAFIGLPNVEETLLREFVPVAVKEAGGFAGFRQGATKTNSPLDRLKGLTLPDIDEVQTGLEQYIKVSERAEELEEKIEKTDQLIDEIIYDLYGLTDEEIEIVESAVQND